MEENQKDGNIAHRDPAQLTIESTGARVVGIEVGEGGRAPVLAVIRGTAEGVGVVKMKTGGAISMTGIGVGGMIPIRRSLKIGGVAMVDGKSGPRRP